MSKLRKLLTLDPATAKDPVVALTTGTLDAQDGTIRLQIDFKERRLEWWEAEVLAAALMAAAKDARGEDHGTDKGPRLAVPNGWPR